MHMKKCETALFFAVKFMAKDGNTEIIECLLRKPEVNIDARNRVRTGLYQGDCILCPQLCLVLDQRCTQCFGESCQDF